nr:glycosyltransferase family 2 protein [[Eubacterium] tenue]
MNKQMDNMVSIVTPVYNAEKFLEETILSVLNQTYTNFELILVNDCSEDNSMQIINRLMKEDDRIKCIDLKENGGAAKARNIGIEAANGKYLAFIDSDDLWKKEKLEKQVEFMEKNNIVFSYTGYDMINEEGQELGKTIKCKGIVNYNELLKYNIIGCLTVMINISVIKNLSMEYINHEDYATWLKILRQGYKAYGINESLASYRKRENSLSGNKVKSAKWTWDIIRNVEKTPLIKSIYYFNIYAFINLKKHFMK